MCSCSNSNDNICNNYIGTSSLAEGDWRGHGYAHPCLLYTSDAADE